MNSQVNEATTNSEEMNENEHTSPSLVSIEPSTSNHHYLYQSQHQLSSYVNRNPNHNLLVSTIIPDSTSIVSASSSNGNGSNDAETVTTATTTTVVKNSHFLCHWCQQMFSIPSDADKRLARSYRSFVIGRFLGVVSSIGLLLGLTVKFFFLDESSSFGSILSYVIIALSLIVFSISAVLVIWATLYKSAKARREFLQAKHPTSTSSQPPFLKEMYKN